MKKILSITALSFALFINSCQNSNTEKVNANTNKAAVKTENTAATTTTQDKCQGERALGCECPQALNLVCGCNGVTYDNPCHAECDGVARYTFGRCPETTAPTKTSSPR